LQHLPRLLQGEFVFRDHLFHRSAEIVLSHDFLLSPLGVVMKIRSFERLDIGR